MTDVVIASAARTAIGSYGKGLASVPPSELGSVAASAALARAEIEPGAIALGHPIGATGAAITTKLLDEMERSDLELGLVTLRIGGGQGIAMLLGRS